MSKLVYVDKKKGSRQAVGRACRSRKKRCHPINRNLMEKEEANASTSAKN